MKRSLQFLFTLLITVTLIIPVYSQTTIELTKIGHNDLSHLTSANAEIGAFDPTTNTFIVTDAGLNALHIFDMTDPTAPAFVDTIDLSGWGGGPNSIIADNGSCVVVVENVDKTLPGTGIKFDITTKDVVYTFQTGALPDMIYKAGPNGYIVANEGEPNDAYDNDPEGSITLVGMGVINIPLTPLNSVELDESIRIFGPGASVAQDLEPEYATYSNLSGNIYVGCQENNAIIEVNGTNLALRIFGLGFKDHSLSGNEFDASNEDAGVNIQNWPTLGMYQPDAIASYTYNYNTYIVTANEGDARDYDGYSEEARVKDLTLDAAAFPDAATLQLDENLGRLKTTTANGDTDNDNEHEVIYSYGARSFSIFDTTGTLVFDSGSDFEDIISNDFPNLWLDSRSDDKGPEPEGLVLGEVEDKTYAFIGLERTGGIMVYEITTPSAPSFVQYIHADPDGNLGIEAPEGLAFIPAEESPNNKPLLVVTYEENGDVVVFEINSQIVPVELTSFSADVNGNDVVLNWATATESNNKGFYVERSSDDNNFITVAFVDGNGTTAEISSYSFTDNNVTVGNFTYRLKQVDFDGTYDYSNNVEVTVGAPVAYALEQNYPNPFNPSTTVSFSVPEAGLVTIKVYDILGNEVATILNSNIEAGNHNVKFNASSLASGMYVYKITANNFTAAKKMMLMK